MIKTEISINEKIRDGLITRLKTHFFTQIVNTSGAPISTVVDNFLIPSLQSSSITGMAGNKWSIIKLRPGINPMESLVNELTKIGNIFTKGTVELGELNRLREVILRNGSNGLTQFIKEAIKLKGSSFNLLIVLEDFESLLLYNQFQEAKGVKGVDIDFMSLLLRGIMDSECPLYFLNGLYPKYANFTIKYLGYPELVHRGRYTLPALTIQDIEAATNSNPIERKLQQVLKNTFVADNIINYQQLFLIKRLASLQSKRSDALKELNVSEVNLIQLVPLFTKDYIQRLSVEEQNILKKVFQQLITKHTTIDAYQATSLHSLALKVFGESATTNEEQAIIKLLKSFNTENFPFFIIDESTSIHTKISSDLIIRLADDLPIQSIQEFSKWENEERISQAAYENVLKQALDYQEAKASSLLLSGYELESTLKWMDNVQPNAHWVLGFTQQNGIPSSLLEKEKSNISAISHFLEQSKIKEETERERGILEAKKKRKRTIIIMFTFLVFGIIASILAVFAQVAKKNAEKAKTAAEQINSNLTYFSLLEKINAENRFSDRGKYLSIRDSVLSPTSSNKIVKDSLKTMIGRDTQQTGKIIDYQISLIQASVQKEDSTYLNSIRNLTTLVDTFNYTYKKEPEFEASLFYSLGKDILEDLEIRNGEKNSRYIQNLDGLLDIAVYPGTNEKYLLLTRYEDIIEYKIDTTTGLKKPTILKREEVGGLSNITYSNNGEFLYGVTVNGEVIKWTEEKDNLIERTRIAIKNTPYLGFIRATSYEDVVIAVSDNSFYIVQQSNRSKKYKPQKYEPQQKGDSFESVHVNTENNLVVVSGHEKSFIYQLKKNKYGVVSAEITLTITHEHKTSYIGAINNKELIALALSDGSIHILPYEKGKYDLNTRTKLQLNNNLNKKDLTYTLDFWNNENKSKDYESLLAVGYVNGIVNLYTISNISGIYKSEQLELRGNRGPVFEVAFNNDKELLAMDEWKLVFYPSSIEQCLDNIKTQYGTLENKFKKKSHSIKTVQ